MENKIKVEITCNIDLKEIKDSLSNSKQSLNNEIVLNFIKDKSIKEALNSAFFIQTETNKSGNKGFLNQIIEEFNKKA